MSPNLHHLQHFISIESLKQSFEINSQLKPNKNIVIKLENDRELPNVVGS